MNELEEEVGKEEKKKVGRKIKDPKVLSEIVQSKSKFYVDVSEQPEEVQFIFDLLSKANQKEYGREIIFKDLVLFALHKINEKDLEKIQEASLNEMEKVKRALDQYNKKNNTVLELGEYLTMKLGIN